MKNHNFSSKISYCFLYAFIFNHQLFDYHEFSVLLLFFLFSFLTLYTSYSSTIDRTSESILLICTFQNIFIFSYKQWSSHQRLYYISYDLLTVFFLKKIYILSLLFVLACSLVLIIFLIFSYWHSSSFY